MRSEVRRWLPILALLAALAAPVGGAAAAPGCQFVLGFAALRDMVGPEKVGDCLENEHANPGNGDSLQQTSGGLLVWRRVDNVAAFTDGQSTWVNGPRGLQRRLNGERFDWEGGGGAAAGAGSSGAPPPAAVSACTDRSAAQVVVARSAPAPSGALDVSGTVTNRCGEAIDVLVDLIARSAPAGQGGQPLADAPTTTLSAIEPGGSRDFSVRVPGAAGALAVSADAFPIPTRLKSAVCLDVGASRCLSVDRRLSGAVAALLPLDAARALVRSAAEDGISIGMVELPRNAEGAYSSRRQAIVLAESLMDSTALVRAAVLVHELRHASDRRAGLLPTRVPQECIQAELRAFQSTVGFWAWVWGDRLPPAIDGMHRAINEMVRRSRESPDQFARGVAETYHDACGLDG